MLPQLVIGCFVKVVCLATIRWLKYDEMLTMAVEWLVLDVTRLQRDLRYAHFTLIAMYRYDFEMCR